MKKLFHFLFCIFFFMFFFCFGFFYFRLGNTFACSWYVSHRAANSATSVHYAQMEQHRTQRCIR